jgi:hypothetical protein
MTHGLGLSLIVQLIFRPSCLERILLKIAESGGKICRIPEFFLPVRLGLVCVSVLQKFLVTLSFVVERLYYHTVLDSELFIAESLCFYRYKGFVEKSNK